MALHPEIAKRIDGEKSEVRAWIRGLKKLGWELIFVDDGGDEWEHPQNEADAIDMIFAVEDSRVHFISEQGRGSIRVILGNSPEEAVADYSAWPDFDKVSEERAKYWDARS